MLMTPGNWSWSDGTPFDYTYWRQGQPKGHNCAAQSWAEGYWTAQDCFKFKPYVCAVSNSIVASTTRPPMTTTVPVRSTRTRTTAAPMSSASPTYPGNYSCSSGWTYFAPTGSCYSDLYKQYLNQSAAESRCQSLGGHLISVHSMTEMNFVAGW